MMTSLAQTALDNLLEMATKSAENSYSPYSGFKVGAALHHRKPRRHQRGKCELRPNHLCVERRRWCGRWRVPECIEAVAVANMNNAASPPCGACRQMLAEFAHPDVPVVFPASDGIRTMSFEQVLPLGFDMKLKKLGNPK